MQIAFYSYTKDQKTKQFINLYCKSLKEKLYAAPLTKFINKIIKKTHLKFSSIVTAAAANQM